MATIKPLDAPIPQFMAHQQPMQMQPMQMQPMQMQPMQMQAGQPMATAVPMNAMPIQGYTVSNNGTDPNQQMMMMQQQQMMMQQQQMMMQAPQQQQISQVDRFGSAIFIKQQFEVGEALTGCESKNRYHVYASTTEENDKTSDGKEFIMFIQEESECFERICCGPNRTLDLVVYDGPNNNGKEIARFHKPFHLQQSCCCRPRYRSQGTV